MYISLYILNTEHLLINNVHTYKSYSKHNNNDTQTTMRLSKDYT